MFTVNISVSSLKFKKDFKFDIQYSLGVKKHISLKYSALYMHSYIFILLNIIHNITDNKLFYSTWETTEKGGTLFTTLQVL